MKNTGSPQPPVARRRDWADVYASLRDRADGELSASELETLADAAWWVCRVEESVSARQKAYEAYLSQADMRRAGYNAWMLSTEYQFLGKVAPASGWLRRAQRHVRDEPRCAEQGFIAFAEAESAESRGDLDGALALADRMAEIGRSCHSRDLVALSLQMQGRLHVAKGDITHGMALLDEAMCDVLAGVLSDLVTGWLYCIAVAVCFDVADLPRAAEWNDAAMAWCESLPVGTPFQGLCRVHSAELIGLRGALDRAAQEADRACEELMAYHPHMAAESFYVAGEIRRRAGDLRAAELLFLRAHETGRDPQPGLALLRLAQGDFEAASAGLRSALDGSTGDSLHRARLLAAQVEVAVAVGDLGCAHGARDELARICATSYTAVVSAMAITADAAVRLAEQDSGALHDLRRARNLWLQLQLPYEAAHVRMAIAAASHAAGDPDTARLELHAARSAFEDLGLRDDARRAADMLARSAANAAALTRREIDVLRLVAAGKTNRDIAEDLVISQHTVARHLNNIFAKVGVSSRAAATAYAYEHGVI